MRQVFDSFARFDDFLAYLGVAFGPPPPSVAAVAWTGIAGGLLTAALGYWIDHHEVVKA